MKYKNVKESIPYVIGHINNISTSQDGRSAIGEAIGYLKLFLDVLEGGAGSVPYEPIQKLRPDFIAGYDAGMYDAKLMAKHDEVPPALPPVEGDLLPQIGSRVQIYLNSLETWVTHTVVGYYVWDSIYHDHKGDCRVFVRVRDAQGNINARLLSDIRYPKASE